MGQYFDHDDVFPIIAKVINERTTPDGPYLTHDEIKQELMSNEEIARVYDRAVTFGDYAGTKEELAANMIAWFSQQITRGMSRYENRFDRTRINNRYAYRMKA